MTTYGYIRVSTDDQALGMEAQRSAILAKFPDAIIEADQGVGGADPERPAFAKIVELLGQGDTVVVVRRDRLARDTMLAAMFDREVERRGARMVSLEGAVTDANDPSSLLLRRVLDAVAEFERAMIRERTRAGLDQARSEGRVGGRRPKLNARQRAEIADSVTSGRKSAAEMARIFGVSQPTVSRIVAARRAFLKGTV